MTEEINTQKHQGESDLVDAVAAVALLVIGVSCFAYWLYTL